jgi:hypothetical protein
MTKMNVRLNHDTILFERGQDSFAVHLHRTLRLPEDGRVHQLPPSLGHFPLRQVSDYRDRVPAAWREHGGVFFPLWQREAMWISFSASGSRPCAVKVAAGKVNAVSGQPWEEGLRSQVSGLRSGSESLRAETRNLKPETSLQDYLVAPPQPWLDGFNTGAGKIRQFVAMPLGMGYTVEGQVTGREDVGGLQLLVVPPKDGLLAKPAAGASFAAAGPYVEAQSSGGHFSLDTGSSYSINEQSLNKGAEMGLAQGGEMVQKIYPDPHGLATWLPEAAGRLFVHIVNSELWRQITGEPAPPSPITARDYTAAGHPWYEIWDAEMADVRPSPTLAGVKTVGQKDASHGFSGQQDDSAVHEGTVSAGAVHPNAVREGKEWG